MRNLRQNQCAYMKNVNEASEWKKKREKYAENSNRIKK